MAQNSKKEKSIEDEICRLEQSEAEAFLKKDFAALDKVAAPDFTMNKPRGVIVKGEAESTNNQTPLSKYLNKTQWNMNFNGTTRQYNLRVNRKSDK